MSKRFDWRAGSKLDWGTDLEEGVEHPANSREVLQLGCLMRIADALEKTAQDRGTSAPPRDTRVEDLIRDNERLRVEERALRSELRSMRRKLTMALNKIAELEGVAGE